ncbi:MAG: DUF927 domain-containing protein [Panacagrimonas sp.]
MARVPEKEAAKSHVDIFICGPLHIEAQTADTTGNSYGRLLRFMSTRDVWRQFSLPMRMLSGDGAEVRGQLMDQGLRINPDQRQHFNRFLQGPAPKNLATCATTIGWADKVTVPIGVARAGSSRPRTI